MSSPREIQIAGVAQKLLTNLFFNCPANYHCGGPAYGALATLDTILHLMGVGVAVLQQQGAEKGAMAEYEKQVRAESVCGTSILGGFMQHKSQILAGSLHAILVNSREKRFRECPEVTEKAMLMLVQYYLDKSGTSKEEFWQKVLKADHNELTQLEDND